MSSEKLEVYDLTVFDRLALRDVLAEQRAGNIEALVIEKFIKDITITEEELVEYNIVGNQMDATKVHITKEFTFTPWRIKKIEAMLTEVHNRGNISQQILPLFKKFFKTPIGEPDKALAEEYAALNMHNEVEKVLEEAE